MPYGKTLSHYYVSFHWEKLFSCQNGNNVCMRRLQTRIYFATAAITMIIIIIKYDEAKETEKKVDKIKL